MKYKITWFGLIVLALTFLLWPLLCMADQAGPATTNGVSIPAGASPGAVLGGVVKWAIPFVVPVLIAGLKVMVARLPGWMLPILAPLLGALLDWVSGGNGVMGAVFGSAGVGLREVLDQAKKRMANGPQ